MGFYDESDKKYITALSFFQPFKKIEKNMLIFIDQKHKFTPISCLTVKKKCFVFLSESLLYQCLGFVRQHY